MANQVLIVDDDPQIIDLIKDILEIESITADHAESAEDAIDLVSKNTYTFIMVDLNLNNVNGAIVVKHINEHEDSKNRDVPIILMSGLIDEEFSKKFNDKFFAILSKPFNTSNFLKTVSKLIKDPKESEMELEGPFPVKDIKNKVNNVLKKAKSSKTLKQIFKEMKISRDKSQYLKVHTGLLINISIALVKELHWGGDSTYEKLIYAAYIKDYPLRKHPDLIRIKNKTVALENENSELIINHPKLAAQICDEHIEIPEDVATIVLQHHELPNGNGFPTGVDQKRISALSSLFIVANDLADYIIDKTNWSMDNYIRKANNKYTGVNFRKVLKALSETKR